MYGFNEFCKGLEIEDGWVRSELAKKAELLVPINGTERIRIRRFISFQT